MKKSAAHSAPGLSSFINRSDGMGADEALRRVELHLASMRGTINQGIADAVTEIGALINPGDHHETEAKYKEIYQLADGILSVASMFEKESLGKIAYSMCDLMGVLELNGRWDNGAVRLHYDAMRLLQASPDLNTEAQEALVSGLEHVVKSISASMPVQPEPLAEPEPQIIREAL